MTITVLCDIKDKYLLQIRWRKNVDLFSKLRKIYVPSDDSHEPITNSKPSDFSHFVVDWSNALDVQRLCMFITNKANKGVCHKYLGAKSEEYGNHLANISNPAFAENLPKLNILGILLNQFGSEFDQRLTSFRFSQNILVKISTEEKLAILVFSYLDDKERQEVSRASNLAGSLIQASLDKSLQETGSLPRLYRTSPLKNFRDLIAQNTLTKTPTTVEQMTLSVQELARKASGNNSY